MIGHALSSYTLQDVEGPHPGLLVDRATVVVDQLAILSCHIEEVVSISTPGYLMVQVNLC